MESRTPLVGTSLTMGPMSFLNGLVHTKLKILLLQLPGSEVTGVYHGGNSTFEEGNVHVLTLLKHYFMALRAMLGELIPSFLETSQDSGTENIRAEQRWIVSKGEGT